MNYQEYKAGVINNIKGMSRTMSGILDMSASETKSDSMAVSNEKEAERLASENISNALDFMIGNIGIEFDSKEKLSSFLLEIAEITDKGIVKDGMLFRSGSDSTKYHYASVADLEYLWDWFVERLMETINSDKVQAIVTAAFAEYYINCAAHFFADGCGKISMLVSSFILMRAGCELPEYRGRDEFYKYGATVVSVSRDMPIDREHYAKFQAYYRSLNGDSETYLHIDVDKEKFTAYAEGVVNEAHKGFLTKGLDTFYSAHPQERLIIDCMGLRLMTSAGTDILKQYAAEGKKFILENLNQDCYAAMLLSGMEEYCGVHTLIPILDISKCRRIGEGSNGIVYAVNDEIIVKTFKKDTDFDSMLKEREVTRHALSLGIPCPISFGYALADGKIALLEEYVKSTSFAKLARKDSANIQKYMGDYVGLIKKLHSLKGEEITHFPRKTFMKEVLMKADRADTKLDDKYKGKLRQIIDSIRDTEVLTHGDIQPNNIRIGDNGASFIDLETLSTGPAIFDLGALRRTLLAEIEFYRPDYNDFIEMSADMVNEIWTSFTEGYFCGESDETVRKKLFYAEVIGDILAFNTLSKRYPDSDAAKNCRRRLMELIEEWDAVKR